MRIRGLLGSDGADLVASTNQGYVLQAGPGGVDIWSFEEHLAAARSLLDAGHDLDAGERIEQGLALWTGLPFDGCEELAEGRAALLQSEFLTATVALAKQWLERSDPAGAGRLIRHARAIDPFDERLARLHLAAIAAAGSSNQKITQAYEAFVLQLEDELSVAPEAATTAAYERLLAGRGQSAGPALTLVRSNPPVTESAPSADSATARTWASGPTGHPEALADRADEIAALHRFFQSAKRVLTVAGARGTGKSAFLRYASTAGLDHSLTVRPFGPTEPGSGMASITSNSTKGLSVLLVADDLHLAARADVSSLIDELQRSDISTRVIVSYRGDWEGPAADAWNDFEDEAAMHRSLDALTLSNLDQDATQALCRSLIDETPDAALVDDLHHRAGGNPLVLTELINCGYQAGDKVPATLLRLVQGEVRQLPVEARQHMDRLAVLGPNVDLSGLADRNGLSETVEAAMRSGLLIESDEDHTVRFAAPLYSQAIYEGLSRHRRHELHAALAEQLRHHPGRRREAARHALCAESIMSSAEVFEIVRAGASTAAERGDSEESTSLYLAAVRLHRLVHPDDQESFTELVVDLYGCVDDTGAPELLEAWNLAVDGARSRHDPALVVRLIESRLDRWIGDNERFTGLLTEAIGWCGDDDLASRARLESRLALEISETVAWPTGYDLARGAEEAARSLGDPSAICPALRALIANSYRDVSPSERLRLANDLTNTARLQLDDDMQMIGMIYAALELIALGRRSDPLRQLNDIHALASDRRRPRYESMAETMRLGMASARGDDDLVDEIMERIELLAEATSNRDAHLTVIGHSVMQRWASGEHQKSAPLLLSAFDSSPMEHWLLFLTATALVEAGDLKEAARVVDGVDYSQLPSGLFYPAFLALGAEVVVALEDIDAAARLTELLTPLEGTTLIFSSGLALLGPTEGFLAELAMVQGHTDRAKQLFELALYGAEQVGDIAIVARLERRRDQTFR